MANQRGASKSGTLIKMTQALVLLLFVSLLAFSAGTFIGKKVSDSEHRRAQLEGEYKGIAEHGDTHEGEKAAGEENLSDDDIASLTEEFVSKSKEEADHHGAAAEKSEPSREVASAPESSGYKKMNGKKEAEPAHGETNHGAPAHGEPTHNAPAHGEPAHEDAHAVAPKPAKKETAHSSPTPSAHQEAAHVESSHSATPAPEKGHAPSKPAAPSAMAARVAEGHAPAPDAKEEHKPASVLPSIAATAVGKFTVQVASYPDEAQAKDHAANLKGGGWNAFYIPAEVQGKTWFRVSVGLFTTAKSATDFKKEFQKESKVATAIVQKIVK